MIHLFVWYEEDKEVKSAIEIAESLRKQYPWTVMVKQDEYAGQCYDQKGVRK